MFYNGGSPSKLSRTQERSISAEDQELRLAKTRRPWASQTLRWHDEKGKAVKFQVGNVNDTTHQEMRRRLDNIRLLYQCSCQEYGIDYWAGWALPWAKRLEKGNVKVHGSSAGHAHRGQAAEELAVAHKLMGWGLPLQIVDYDLQVSGNKYLAELIEMEVQKAVQKAVAAVQEDKSKSWGADFVQAVKSQVVPENIMDAETTTLHQALEEWKAEISTNSNGKITHTINNKHNRIKYLQEHHQDFPLWRFNLTECTRIVSHWANHPNTKKGVPCSDDHAEDMIKSFKEFCKWLDSSPNFKWQKPKGFDAIDFRVKKTKNNGGWQTVAVPTYTIEELIILLQHANRFERALIGVCVNCAFGQSEVGQWTTENFAIHTAHPHSKQVDYASTDADSWVFGFRPKTQVYGEHLLWDEVAQAVNPFLDGRPFLPMSQIGKPWYRVDSKNSQAKFGNVWDKLLNRVQKHHPDFRRLPFGSLRDLLPNIIEREFDKETADIALQHGAPDHQILRCYSNVPYKKVFRATVVLKPMFQPFLDELQRLANTRT